METVLLNFNRIPILTPEESEKVFQELVSMRKLWIARTNWHPALEIAGPDSGIEKYVHYYTLGAALYMDARDRGWGFYNKLQKMYNRVLWKRLGWLYDTFLEKIQDEIGSAEYEDSLGLPGYHIYEFENAPTDRKHHRCLHYDGQWWYARNYFKQKYGVDNVDWKNQLSMSFTIKAPHNGSAIALWDLPKKHHSKAADLQYIWYHDIIKRYANVEYVKEIKEANAIEDPWKFKLFDKDCGDLEQYIPYIIPHYEGHCFHYSGMIMHQMILGDGFKDGDYRITFQGHGLKCNGKWRLFW